MVRSTLIAGISMLAVANAVTVKAKVELKGSCDNDWEFDHCKQLGYSVPKHTKGKKDGDEYTPVSCQKYCYSKGMKIAAITGDACECYDELDSSCKDEEEDKCKAACPAPFDNYFCGKFTPGPSKDKDCWYYAVYKYKGKNLPKPPTDDDEDEDCGEEDEGPGHGHGGGFPKPTKGHDDDDDHHGGHPKPTKGHDDDDDHHGGHPKPTKGHDDDDDHHGGHKPTITKGPGSKPTWPPKDDDKDHGHGGKDDEDHHGKPRGTKTYTVTSVETITSCPPEKTNCPYAKKTHTITTTSCYDAEVYTKTWDDVKTYTVTACPETVTACPYGKTTTETVPCSTVMTYNPQETMVCGDKDDLCPLAEKPVVPTGAAAPAPAAPCYGAECYGAKSNGSSPVGGAKPDYKTAGAAGVREGIFASVVGLAGLTLGFAVLL